VLLAITCAGMCLWPHASRLLHPSLFSDDVIRIADLQTRPLARLLFRPFNEHVAPIFEAVSWVTWRLAGQRLSYAAAAFTTASLLPFLLCLPALCVLVDRETRSPTTGLCAAVLLCLSPVHAEAVWWYSASSFTWALLGTLCTWLCLLHAHSPDRRPARANGWWLGAFLSAAAAPACSAVGLLAGPLGALRSMLAPGPVRRRASGMIVPLAGTLTYLMIAGGTRYGRMLGSSVERSPNAAEGLLCCLRAPADILLMGLLGMENGDRWLTGGSDVALGVLLVAGAAFLAWRSRQRPMILCGLVSILGGYAMTYGVRNIYGTHWLMEVQRYHLFPQLGCVLIVAGAARPILARLDAQTRAPLRCATLLALFLLVTNCPLWNSRLRSYQFPAQQATLCALERLDQLCRARGITRAQARAALGPVRPRWVPHDSCVLAMLPDVVSSPSLGEDDARATLISSLSDADREALCGGFDATEFVQAPPLQTGEPLAVGRFVSAAGFTSSGAGRWRAERGPAYLEFSLAHDAGGSEAQPARWLCIRESGSATRIEMWWSASRGLWTESRSVHWRPLAERAVKVTPIPLDRLPHWSQDRASRVRFIVRSSGPVTLESPRLLR
jgi:hypothetical protein